MKSNKTPIPDLLVLKSTKFIDNRGIFFESYNLEAYREAGITDNFIQDNMLLIW